MYRIAVLANDKSKRMIYADQIEHFCRGKGLFPDITQYQEQEQFFAGLPDIAPTNAVIARRG